MEKHEVTIRGHSLSIEEATKKIHKEVKEDGSETFSKIIEEN